MVREGSSPSVFGRLRPSSDAGLGLPEILVAVVVSGMVLSVVVGMALNSSDVMQRTDLRSRSTQQLTVALEHMGRMLQSTYRSEESDGALLRIYDDPIRTGSPEELTVPTSSGVEATFRSNAGTPNDPLLIHWYVDTEMRLIEERTPRDPDDGGYPDYATQPIQRRILLEHVVLPTSGQRPLFSWFGPQSTTSLNPDDPYEPLSWRNMRRALAVQINLTVRPPAHRATTASMQAFYQLGEDVASLPQPPTWTSAPSDEKPLPETPCTTCGGLPTRRAYPENYGSTDTGSGGGTVVTGPVAGLA